MESSSSSSSLERSMQGNLFSPSLSGSLGFKAKGYCVIISGPAALGIALIISLITLVCVSTVWGVKLAKRLPLVVQRQRQLDPDTPVRFQMVGSGDGMQETLGPHVAER